MSKIAEKKSPVTIAATAERGLDALYTVRNELQRLSRNLIAEIDGSHESAGANACWSLTAATGSLLDVEEALDVILLAGVGLLGGGLDDGLAHGTNRFAKVDSSRELSTKAATPSIAIHPEDLLAHIETVREHIEEIVFIARGGSSEVGVVEPLPGEREELYRRAHMAYEELRALANVAEGR